MVLVKRNRTSRPIRLPLTAVLLALTFLTAPLSAQDGRPGPDDPQSGAAGGGEEGAQTGGEQSAGQANARSSDPQRPADPRGDEMVALAFDEEAIDDRIFAFIAESTGKVVMPMDLITFQNKKITLIRTTPIPRSEALDLLFQALRLNSVGVIEKEPTVDMAGNLSLWGESVWLPAILLTDRRVRWEPVE